MWRSLVLAAQFTVGAADTRLVTWEEQPSAQQRAAEWQHAAICARPALTCCCPDQCRRRAHHPCCVQDAPDCPPTGAERRRFYSRTTTEALQDVQQHQHKGAHPYRVVLGEVRPVGGA